MFFNIVLICIILIFTEKYKNYNYYEKIIFALLAVLFATFYSYAQDEKKDAETVKTKMDEFTSKTGAITKFTDYSLPNLKTTYASPVTRIRKVESGNAKAFFYQIEKEGKYSSTTASIEHSDLVEVLKAIKVLIDAVDTDIAANPDYMENKFVTVDGFQVGYYISKGKASWYLKLTKYGSDNTLFMSDGDSIEQAFTDAKNKIDSLK
ncbi:MAG: hypothetical protein LBG19_07885 [Prevotellaceae bacterium]|jgi:hypothetical protein|nr:hypothetical protein [Prevotellaceae bacterium]